MENVSGAKGQGKFIFEPARFVKEQEIVDSVMALASAQSATGGVRSGVRYVMAGVL